MPKTITSERNKLTSSERKVYKNNLRFIQTIRNCFLKDNPNFDYIRVFTEAQTGGKCRTKFWGVNKKDKNKLIKYLTNRYLFYCVRKGCGSKTYTITWKTDKANSVIIYVQ